MEEPDENRATEIDLEMNQRIRLLELFRLVKTYDAREAVIAFCEDVVSENEN